MSHIVVLAVLVAWSLASPQSTEREVEIETGNLRVHSAVVVPVQFAEIEQLPYASERTADDSVLSHTRHAEAILGGQEYPVASFILNGRWHVCAGFDREKFDLSTCTPFRPSASTESRWIAELRLASGLPVKFLSPDGGSRAFLFDKYERRGIAQLPAGVMQLAVVGDPGRFDDTFALVYFDVNRDGQFEFELPVTPERVTLQDPYVRLDGAEYRISVAADGRRVTLTPVPDGSVLRPEVAIGKEVPDLDFVGFDGTPYSLSQFRGETVVLHSWGTWCGPCRPAIPHLVRIQESIGRDRVRFVGINIRDDLEVARQYARSTGMNWLHSQQTIDSDLVIWLGMQGLPTATVIDHNGRLVAAGIAIESLEAAIRDAISKQAEAP